MIVYRQGDVVIKAKTIPTNATTCEERPLAYGELTGHSHRIVEGRVEYYLLGVALYIRVLSEFAKLLHEEHEDVILPTGDYEVNIQQQFDYQEFVLRNVID